MNRRRLWNLFSRRVACPSQADRPSPIGMELLEDRLAPALFTATINPAVDNAGAVAEVIGFFEASNANTESDTIKLYPGGVYGFDTFYSTPLGPTLNALPVLVPNPGGTISSVNIEGQGATFRRTGTATYRLMEIAHQPSFGKVDPMTIRDLSIENGYIGGAKDDGGGVKITGNPTTIEFNNVIFSDNATQSSSSTTPANGGAVALSSLTGGKVRFVNSVFVRNSSTVAPITPAITVGAEGGAVFADGDVDIVQTKFSNNFAKFEGGAILHTAGNLAIDRSAFRSNFSRSKDGGAVNHTGGDLTINATLFTQNSSLLGAGGAVISGSSVNTFTNNTFEANVAATQGGAVSFEAGVSGSLNYNTITNNVSNNALSGGGVHLATAATGITFSHNVFSANTNAGVGKPGNEASDLWGNGYTSGGFNFISIGKSTGQLVYSPLPSDQFGQASAPIDPQLGPLQQNGGSTLTRSPLLGSPLINTGDFTTTAGVTSDARGYPRLVGGNADIGAVEVQYDPSTNTSTPSIIITDGNRQTTAAGSFFAKPLEVTLVDPFGTPVAGRTVSFAGPGAIFPTGGSVVSDANGKAAIVTFANNLLGSHPVVVTLDGTTITATFRELTIGGSGTVSITQGDAQSAIVTTPYADSLAIQVLDASGAPAVNTPVYFGVVPGTAGGTFANGQSLIGVTTDGAGKASVPFTANTKAGPVSVIVGAGDFGSTTFHLTNLAGAPATIQPVSGDGQSTQIFQNFAAPLTVEAQDQYGNVVANVPITFTGTTSTSLPGSTFPGGSTAVTDASGRASVTAAANSKVGGHAVVATSSAAAGTITFNLTNTFGAAATIVAVSGSNQSATVTQGFANPLVVQVFDAGGNALPNAGVNFTGPSGTGAGPQFPSGAFATTDAQGIATLGVAANTRSGVYPVTASIVSGSQATFSLTNVAGAPALLSIVDGNNQSAPVNTVFGKAVRVSAIDSFGNPILGAVPTFLTPSGASATFSTSPSDEAGISNSIVTANGTEGSYRVTVRLGSTVAILDLSNTAAVAPPITPQTGLPSVYAAGTGEGIPHRVYVYNDQNQLIREFQPYDAGFSGGVRTTVARTPDGLRIVTAPGPGRYPDVRFFDMDGNLVRSHQPFESNFTGGVFLAAADINRDGWDDIVLSADLGGGPRVQVVSGKDGAVLADFFGIDDPAFRGGARVAAGDVDGDGTPEVIVAAGFGGGPRIAIFRGDSIASGQVPQRLVGDFFAFEVTLRNGVFVTAGDVNGDGKADLAFGGGPTAGPRVLAISGADLLQNRFSRIADFFAGDSNSRNGIRVALKDLDHDNLADLVTGDGAGTGTRVTIYPGSYLLNNSLTSEITSFDPLPGSTIGVYVG